MEPLGLDVVDLEVDVGHEAGLDAGQIDADDLGVGVPLGHVDGPRAGPGAQLQYLPGALLQRGEEHLALADILEQVGVEVSPVLLALVVWQRVATFPERMKPVCFKNPPTFGQREMLLFTFTYLTYVVSRQVGR